MLRQKISSGGIVIAKHGYDANTATLEQLNFSTDRPTYRLVMTGVVTATRYSGPLSSRYARAIVTYDEPFEVTPLVLIAGVVSGTESDQTPFVPQAFVSDAMWAWHCVGSYKDRLEIYVYDRDSGGGTISRPTRTYRYFVFHNTIDDGT